MIDYPVFTHKVKPEVGSIFNHIDDDNLYYVTVATNKCEGCAFDYNFLDENFLNMNMCNNAPNCDGDMHDANTFTLIFKPYVEQDGETE